MDYERADAAGRGGRQDVRQRQSRDWAAKGPMLLGVRAAFAESFERIHRSNLIGMGVLPLQFAEGESAESLGLDGSEQYTVGAVDFSKGLPEPRVVDVMAKKRPAGPRSPFKATVRVDTPTEGKPTTSMAAFCSTFFASWRNRGGGRTRRFAKGECNASGGGAALTGCHRSEYKGNGTFGFKGSWTRSATMGTLFIHQWRKGCRETDIRF